MGAERLLRIDRELVWNITVYVVVYLITLFVRHWKCSRDVTHNLGFDLLFQAYFYISKIKMAMLSSSVLWAYHNRGLCGLSHYLRIQISGRKINCTGWNFVTPHQRLHLMYKRHLEHIHGEAWCHIPCDI